MRKLSILLLLGAIAASEAGFFVSPKCQDGDYYSACYNKLNKCGGSLDSNIVFTLEDCGNIEQNACDDFFERANSRLQNRGTERTHLEEIKMNYNKNIRDNIGIYNRKLSKIQIVIGNYLGHCMLENEDVKDYRPPVLDGLESIQALHWPNWTLAMEQAKWEQRDFQWPNALGILRRLGLNNVFFKEHVSLASNDANKLIVKLEMPDEIEDVFDNVRYTFSSYNIIESSTYKYGDFLRKVYELYEGIKKLQETYMSPEKEVQDKQEIWTLAKLKQEIPFFDWQQYFNALLQRPIDAEHFELELSNLSYFKDIATLLNKTDEKELNFYILWRFINFYLDITPRDKGITCEENVANQFAFNANYFYNQVLQKDFESKEKALLEIFNALKVQFMENLNKNKYELSEAQLAYLREKLNKIELRIGSTPLDLPAEYYDEFYKDAKITQDTKFMNDMRQVMQVRVAKQHERIFITPAKTDLDYYFAFYDGFVQPIEPFYVTRRNFIVVPQSFLVPPYVMSEMHEVFQHATTGFGIARALIEGFMDVNIIYDAQGIESQIGYDIFHNANYQADLTCVHDASNKLEERFPDIPALQLVIDTFYKNIPDKTQDAIEVNFYISFRERPDNMKDLFFRFLAQYFRGSKSYHSKTSSAERLNGLMRQIPQFAEVYNCTTVNTKICSLWS